jgi:preprotein translocase subunit SecG
LTTLYSVLIAIDVLLASGIITLVLLQHGKGADAGAAFGSGASATVFGARGSTSFLSRSTAVLAALFFLNSLTLAYLASHQPKAKSVVDQVVTEPVPEHSPAAAPAGKASDVPDGEMMVTPKRKDESPLPIPANKQPSHPGSDGNVSEGKPVAPDSKDNAQSTGSAKPEDVP